MKYIPRAIESVIKKAARQSPAVLITGPRQSGKTTLLKRLFSKTHGYVSLDDPQMRLKAVHEPELFFENFPPPVIIDEVQYAPQIFSYLKIHIDEHRSKKGQFLLTGSQSFPLMTGVTESLAGRIFIFDLLSLSLKEQTDVNRLSDDALRVLTLRGGFPELAVDKKQDRDRWFKNYLQTYLERDVRQLRQIGNLVDFQRFMELLAALNGQVLQLSNISQDLGVAVNTIKSWVSILQASHQIIIIPPFYKNKGKRIIKSPKVYFLDTGLLCFLNGITSAAQVFKGPLSGQLLENVVLGEIVRGYYNRGEMLRVSWWRTSHGEEVDFILERHGKIIPVEIKMTAGTGRHLIKNLESFRGLFREETVKGYLVNLSKQKWNMGKGIEIIPLKQFLAEI